MFTIHFADGSTLTLDEHALVLAFLRAKLGIGWLAVAA